MSLKTDYWDGATGLNQKIDASFDLGVAWVVTKSATISTDLKVQAARGMKDFVLSYATTDNLTNMFANNGDNLIAQAYLNGVAKGLTDENIYAFDCTPALTGIVTLAYIQLTFTL